MPCRVRPRPPWMTIPRMQEVESRLEQRSRATHDLCPRGYNKRTDTATTFRENALTQYPFKIEKILADATREAGSGQRHEIRLFMPFRVRLGRRIENASVPLPVKLWFQSETTYFC